MATMIARVPTAGPSRRCGNAGRRGNARRTRGALACLLTLICVSGGLVEVSTAAASTKSHVNATQRLVVLLYGHRAYRSPRISAPQLAPLPAKTPITGEQTTLPVIGVPVRSKALHGVDSLLSIAQMPPGVPVATMAIGGAVNAALLAARILALGDTALAERMAAYVAKMHAAAAASSPE